MYSDCCSADCALSWKKKLPNMHIGITSETYDGIVGDIKILWPLPGKMEKYQLRSTPSQVIDMDPPCRFQFYCARMLDSFATTSQGWLFGWDCFEGLLRKIHMTETNWEKNRWNILVIIFTISNKWNNNVISCVSNKCDIMCQIQGIWYFDNPQTINCTHNLKFF